MYVWPITIYYPKYVIVLIHYVITKYTSGGNKTKETIKAKRQIYGNGRIQRF